MSDFTKEAGALERLRQLMGHEQDGSSQLAAEVQKAVADDFLKAPRRTLTRIYDKLDILKAAGLDVGLHEMRHHLFDKQLEDATHQLKEVAGKADTTEGEDWIEMHVDAYQDYLFTILYINALEQEVDLQCRNYIKMAGKLLGDETHGS
ncbi:hypothetical protein [Nitrososphaera sp.]|uniref:hypothetical protein n=1 Tax=Nitrososphaera sp. TaxID=1971748 RepID=UPI0018150A88|nr:hypothetical protein [Nitrososphaera sp.]NWG36014.1 hypothetical protein [Nitrososphaera sp.]